MSVNQALPKSKKFKAGDNKKYEIKAIIDSVLNDQQTNNQMPGLYYLILRKSYSKEKNISELISIVMHL